MISSYFMNGNQNWPDILGNDEGNGDEDEDEEEGEDEDERKEGKDRRGHVTQYATRSHFRRTLCLLLHIPHSLSSFFPPSCRGHATI